MGTPNTGSISATPFYGISTGARACGMGGAYTAVAEDADSVFDNPAGLVKIATPEYAPRTDQLIFQLGMNDNVRMINMMQKQERIIEANRNKAIIVANRLVGQYKNQGVTLDIAFYFAVNYSKPEEALQNAISGAKEAKRIAFNHFLHLHHRNPFLPGDVPLPWWY